MKRKQTTFPILVAGLQLVAIPVFTQNQVKRPNIIFLMDDQHRWDALGLENKEVITPNIVKLAKDGVRFTQAVCQVPMCIPSRNSMMFGLYANQTGVLRNGKGIPDDQLPMKPLAQVFKDACEQQWTEIMMVRLKNNRLVTNAD